MPRRSLSPQVLDPSDETRAQQGFHSADDLKASQRRTAPSNARGGSVVLNYQAMTLIVVDVST